MWRVIGCSGLRIFEPIITVCLRGMSPSKCAKFITWNQLVHSIRTSVIHRSAAKTETSSRHTDDLASIRIKGKIWYVTDGDMRGYQRHCMAPFKETANEHKPQLITRYRMFKPNQKKVKRNFYLQKMFLKNHKQLNW